MNRHVVAVFFLLVSFAVAKSGEPRESHVQSDKSAITKSIVVSKEPRKCGDILSKLPISARQHPLSLNPVGLRQATHAAAPNTALNGTTIPTKH